MNRTDRSLFAALLVGAALVSIAMGALVSSTGHLWQGLATGVGLFGLTGAFPALQLLRRPQASRPVPASTSPVPWIANAVWARSATATRLDPAETVFISPMPEALAVTPVGPQVSPMSEDALREALATTPDVLSPFRNESSWGRCCERLMVLRLASPEAPQLVEFEGRVGAPLDRLLPDPWPAELAAIRAGDAEENGVHVFECSACGRLAGALLHT